MENLKCFKNIIDKWFLGIIMLIYGDIREQEKSVMDIELKYIEKKISNEIIINKENKFILFITTKYILNMEMIYRGFIIL